MNLLPPRPHRLRLSFWLSHTGSAVLLEALGIGLVMTCDFVFVCGGVIAIAAGAGLLRRGRRVLRAIREGEEVVAELDEQQRTDDRVPMQHIPVERTHYLFRLGEQHHGWAASNGAQAPLFLDDKHRSALALRAPSGEVVFVRADFWPFAFSADEERAIRERIEQRNQMRKLVSDIHTC